MIRLYFTRVFATSAIRRKVLLPPFCPHDQTAQHSFLTRRALGLGGADGIPD
jgi:hypothetical protein